MSRARRRSSFGSFVTRLLIAGALVLICFPLGVLAYLHELAPHQAQLDDLQPRITQAASHDITVNVASTSFTIQKGQILNWTEPYTRAYDGQPDVRFTSALTAFVGDLAQKTNRDPVDSLFTIASGSTNIIKPGQNGQRLNVASASLTLRRGILADQDTITLHPDPVPPANVPDEVIKLGLNALIATGTSDFSGSTANRIQNIKVALQKYNGLIIQPNTTFSFNDILGDVTASTGYAPEKVIDGQKIQYEYGGGICQVSTTLFRAAIYAGFQIVERKPHAFPVHYYEPQGFDATIYPGSSDLRFINNTPGPVLLQSHITGHKLTFQIYGTSDGRTVTIDGPYEYNVQPDGSMDAYFTRTIQMPNGASTSKTFTSIYKSPSLFPTEKNPYD